ncbi:MAG: hypothetical protein JNJ51_09285 [Methylobacillus glycogenes]|nr:hypothetical protein [Methylobacillus glycogenes]
MQSKLHLSFWLGKMVNQGVVTELEAQELEFWQSLAFSQCQFLTLPPRLDRASNAIYLMELPAESQTLQ